MNSTEVENSQCTMQVALLAGVKHVSWFDFSVAHKTFDFPQAMWYGGAFAGPARPVSPMEHCEKFRLCTGILFISSDSSALNSQPESERRLAVSCTHANE